VFLLLITTLLPPLRLLITVTFSTPTGDNDSLGEIKGIVGSELGL
jgi:hypothetical protein